MNCEKLNIGIIEFIITYKQTPPFAKSGRQKTIELFPSIKSMIYITFMDTYKKNRFYEFLCSKYHITILIYDLLHEKILYKLRYETYEQYLEMIQNSISKLN